MSCRPAPLSSASSADALVVLSSRLSLQSLGIHNYPGQHIALGLQQHKGALLQVPLAQLQAMSSVGSTVQGVAGVLPLFQTAHAGSASGVCCCALPRAPACQPSRGPAPPPRVRIRLSLVLQCYVDAGAGWKRSVGIARAQPAS